MGMVDAKYMFIWASCGYPGNSHDSIIMQSTTLWQDIAQGKILPEIAKNVGGVDVPPLIVGDSAFPFQTWLMKPYTNAVLTEKQKYFNYRLSRARMVTERAYGQLKGRWRVLYWRNECSQKNVGTVTMACIVLHIICINRGDSLSRKMDLTIDPVTGERRDRDVIRNLLQMTRTPPDRHTCYQATLIRNWQSEKVVETERKAWGLLNSSLSVKTNLGLIQWDITDMLGFHNSLALAGELVYNQQGNITCLDILNCYDTSSLLLIASWFRFLSCYAVGSSVLRA